MNWDNVEMIRDAQKSAKKRFNEEQLLNTERIEEAVKSAARLGIQLPAMTELEQMIFKMRAELIDYIVAHGIVDGLIWDGVLTQTQSGKIVITRDMVEAITRKLGYFTELDVQSFLERYLPENFYVSDKNYVHTDNNFTTEEKTKLAGIANGAEVNKVIDVIFNSISVVDPETRVATIEITPADIKAWYEANPDTNAFTDAQKEKLAGIAAGAEVNRVDDVLVDGRSVLDANKKAKITKEIIKTAYEANPDTNALTDKEKAELGALNGWKTGSPTLSEVTSSVGELGDEVNAIAGTVKKHTDEINSLQQATTAAAIKAAYESNPDTNAFTDEEKQKLAGLANGAEVNKVDDVKLDGVSIVKNKVAELTAANIKKAYESNPDTNPFTDEAIATIKELGDSAKVYVVNIPQKSLLNIPETPDGFYNVDMEIYLTFKAAETENDVTTNIHLKGGAVVGKQNTSAVYISGSLTSGVKNIGGTAGNNAAAIAYFSKTTDLIYVIVSGKLNKGVELYNEAIVTKVTSTIANPWLSGVISDKRFDFPLLSLTDKLDLTIAKTATEAFIRAKFPDGQLPSSAGVNFYSLSKEFTWEQLGISKITPAFTSLVNGTWNWQEVQQVGNIIKVPSSGNLQSGEAVVCAPIYNNFQLTDDGIQMLVGPQTSGESGIGAPDANYKYFYTFTTFNLRIPTQEV